jgi:hypothetical protein
MARKQKEVKLVEELKSKKSGKMSANKSVESPAIIIPKTPKKSKKEIPVDAVLEMADKAPQEARAGGLPPKSNEKSVDVKKDGKATLKPGQIQIQIDTEFLKTTRCHIAMPCYGGMLTESTFMSFIKFSNATRQMGIDWTIETMVNESLISRARNTLTAKFLHQKESTHLMFIDADIGWEAWHLLALLNHNKDMIGGLYPMKSMPIKWVVNGFDGAETGENGLQEVSKAGTGFLLTKRDVFSKLATHPAVKSYKNDIGLDPVYDQYLRTYWDTAVRQGRYYSEDWTACENWRDVGGKIWIDKRILLRHTGSYMYCMENQQLLLDSIGPQYMDIMVKSGKAQLIDTSKVKKVKSK